MEQFINTFFNWEHLTQSFPQVWRGFVINLEVMLISEVLVLVWAMVLALARGASTPLLRPVRWASIVYIDLFRGLPALLVVYMIVFGFPIANVPVVGEWSNFQLAILALTIVYGAYVAEVYRAGIESVHRSQTSAARSLGLSHATTMRYVVLPQAVRRVIPPLLNDFIALQKETIFVGVVGVLEGFRRAQIYSGTFFNLSSFTGLGLLFLLLTIPMTRFTDYLLERDQRRMRATA
ncbi:MAG: amino acid ABC transporter permease [Acidimicrobiales bacterium]